MSKWAVRLDDQIIWTCNGKEELYDTEIDAEKALIDEIEACERAFQAGYMEDAGDFDNYRIVEILNANN
jgi:hypothetical protein